MRESASSPVFPGRRIASIVIDATSCTRCYFVFAESGALDANSPLGSGPFSARTAHEAGNPMVSAVKVPQFAIVIVGLLSTVSLSGLSTVVAQPCSTLFLNYGT